MTLPQPTVVIRDSWGEPVDRRPRAGDEQYVYRSGDGEHLLVKVVHTGEFWQADGIVSASSSLASLAAAARLLTGVAALELERDRLDAAIAEDRRRRALGLIA